MCPLFDSLKRHITSMLFLLSILFVITVVYYRFLRSLPKALPKPLLQFTAAPDWLELDAACAKAVNKPFWAKVCKQPIGWWWVMHPAKTKTKKASALQVQRAFY